MDRVNIDFRGLLLLLFFEKLKIECDYLRDLLLIFAIIGFENEKVEESSYYMNQRWYDSETGNFIQEDEAKDGINYYGYCGNNPVNFVDPLGLDTYDPESGDWIDVNGEHSDNDTDSDDNYSNDNGYTYQDDDGIYHHSNAGLTYETERITNDPVDNSVNENNPFAGISDGRGDGGKNKDSLDGFVNPDDSNLVWYQGTHDRFGRWVEKDEYYRNKDLSGLLDSQFVLSVLPGLIKGLGGCLAGGIIRIIKKNGLKFGANALVSLSKTGTPQQIGKWGEQAVGNIGDKIKILVNGRTRIPDGLTQTTLSEVKNVQSLSFKSQLRDFYDYAKTNNLNFELYVRPSTKLSGPLMQEIQNGNIYLKFIPGAK